MTTAQEWATMVLNDLGAPVSANNLNNMLAWMLSENSWPPPRNNPLNNGLGSGGGSGLGSYPDLATAAHYAALGMQGQITGAGGINGQPGIAQALVSDAPFAVFHQATINATWSGDHYAGTDWLGATSPASMGISGANAANPLAGLSAQDAASLNAAVAAGGGAYLTAMAAQKAASSATAGTDPYAALKSLSPSQVSALQAAQAAGGGDYLTALAAQNAAIPGGVNTAGNGAPTSSTANVAANSAAGLNDIIASVLEPYGLDTGAILNWATNASTNFASQGMTETQIATQLGVELQAPQVSTTDPLLAAAQQQFQHTYPGLAIRAKNGLPPITIATYQQYQDAVYQAASAVGLTPAQLNAVDGGNAVGNLIGNDVSAAEVTQRLQQGYDAATQANPETLKLLQEYFPTTFPQGVNGAAPTNSAILSYYLNPSNTVTNLVNQMTAAQIGTEGVNSEFGGIPVAQAQALQQAGVTQTTARDTFKTLSKLTPLENQLPGVAPANGAISQGDLVNYGFFGANAQEVENVQATRQAPFKGGGGYAQSSKGVVGAGGASTEGQQGT